MLRPGIAVTTKVAVCLPRATSVPRHSRFEWPPPNGRGVSDASSKSPLQDRSAHVPDHPRWATDEEDLPASARRPGRLVALLAVCNGTCRRAPDAVARSVSVLACRSGLAGDVFRLGQHAELPRSSGAGGGGPAHASDRGAPAAADRRAAGADLDAVRGLAFTDTANRASRYAPKWGVSRGRSRWRPGAFRSQSWPCSRCCWCATPTRSTRTRHWRPSSRRCACRLWPTTGKWLFIYPDQGIASLGEMAVPAGRPIAMELTSATVMQSLYIPPLGSQMYAMGGMVTRLHLMASSPGRFLGENTLFNGRGFHQQKFATVAMSAADFEAWDRARSQHRPAADTGGLPGAGAAQHLGGDEGRPEQDRCACRVRSAPQPLSDRRVATTLRGRGAGHSRRKLRAARPTVSRPEHGLAASSLGSPGARLAALLDHGSEPDARQRRQRRHCQCRCCGRRVRRHRRDRADHLGRQVEGLLVRVADQRRSQEDRHHVRGAVARHADACGDRGRPDAQPTGIRVERRIPFTRPLLAALQHPRLDHDLLHGHAVPDRRHQLRDAAADRRARRVFSGDEFGEPRPDGGRRGHRHDLARAGQVLDRRLERLSALYRRRIQPGPRGPTTGSGRSRCPASARRSRASISPSPSTRNGRPA